MSASDINFWQLILAIINTFVILVGGVLAILGYRKIIKSTDENARIRQQELQQAASTLHTLTGTFANAVQRDVQLVAAFMLVAVLAYAWTIRIVFQVGRRVKKLEARRK